MLRWAIAFAIIAIIAAAFGFGGLAGTSTDIAKFLALVFLVLFVIALVVGRSIAGPAHGIEPVLLAGRRRPDRPIPCWGHVDAGPILAGDRTCPGMVCTTGPRSFRSP